MVCNKGKRQKDETSASSHNQIYDTSLPLETKSRRIELDNQMATIRKHTVVSQIKPTHEETMVQFPNKTLPESLPFDIFRTTEDFFTQLQSTSSYKTENGLLADIVKCDRTDGGILLLYRDPAEVRTYCPFHLAIINDSNGILVRKKAADFTNRRVALNSYYMRLAAMGNRVYLNKSDDVGEGELLF